MKQFIAARRKPLPKAKVLTVPQVQVTLPSPTPREYGGNEFWRAARYFEDLYQRNRHLGDHGMVRIEHPTTFRKYMESLREALRLQDAASRICESDPREWEIDNHRYPEYVPKAARLYADIQVDRRIPAAISLATIESLFAVTAGARELRRLGITSELRLYRRDPLPLPYQPETRRAPELPRAAAVARAQPQMGLLGRFFAKVLSFGRGGTAALVN